MKICTQCKEAKDESQFAKSKRGKNGLRSYCKACENRYMKNYLNETGAGRFRRLKENALKDGVAITISRDDFVNWFSNQERICFYCHTPLEFIYGRHWQWNGLTIDRLNPDKGYAPDNIVLACRRCNIIKGYWFTKEQMLEIAIKYLRG